MLAKEIHNSELLGGKGNLLNILSGVASVPKFTIISSETCYNFFKHFGIDVVFNSYWEAVNMGAPKDLLNSVRKSIINSILSAPLPKDIEDELLLKFEMIPGEVKIARSSASNEDGVERSWAGQFSSYFFTNSKEYIKAVRMCWASIATEGVANYGKVDKCKPPRIAVILQQAIEGAAGGVVFSVDPTAKYKGPLLEATWGLGGPLVSGLVTPERWTIDENYKPIRLQLRGTGTVDLLPNDKDITPGSSYFVPTPFNEAIEIRAIGRRTNEGLWTGTPVIRENNNQYVLTEEQCLQISNFAIERSKINNRAVELEWVIDKDGHIWWLQERPITIINSSKTKQLNISDQSVLAIGTTGAEGTICGFGWWEEESAPQCDLKQSILFKKTTTPSDVPLLMEIGGLATLDGGILSHSAIVSRELGIPCLIGTRPFPPLISLEGKIILDATAGEIRRFNYENTRLVNENKTKIKMLGLDSPLPSMGEGDIKWWCGEELISRIKPELKHQLNRVSSLPGVIGQIDVLPDVKEPHRYLGFPIGIAFRSQRFHPTAVSDCGDGFRACYIENITPAQIEKYSDKIVKNLEKWLGNDGIRKKEIENEISISKVFEEGLGALKNTRWAERHPELVDSYGFFDGGSADLLEPELKKMAQKCLSWHGEAGHFMEFLAPAITFDSHIYDANSKPIVLFHTGSIELGIEFLRRTYSKGIVASEREGLDDPDSRANGLWGLDITNPTGGIAVSNAIGLVNFSFARRAILQYLLEEALIETFGVECRLNLISDVVHTAVQKDRDALLHRQGVQSLRSTKSETPLIISGAPKVASYMVSPINDSPTNWCSHGKINTPYKRELERIQLAEKISNRTILYGPANNDVVSCHAQAVEAVEILSSQGIVNVEKMLLPLICFRGANNGRPKLIKS